MPANYTVRASVVDIRTDTPRPTDRFFLDTNVWAWNWYFTSVTPGGATIRQRADYVGYLQQMRAVGATRCRSGLSLAELAHLIEQNELDAYSISVGPLSVKEYRHNVPSERARVVREIEKAWQRVEADSDLLLLPIDAATTASALSRLASEPVDGYDVFLREAMIFSGVTQVLSDDGDFCCVAGVELFTANLRVIAAARAQGRLLVR